MRNGGKIAQKIPFMFLCTDTSNYHQFQIYDQKSDCDANTQVPVIYSIGKSIPEGSLTLETTKEREMDNPKNEYMISTTIKKGEVELFNNKEEMVKCKVEYQLQGEMLDSEPPVKDRIENNGYRNYGLNSLSKQIWEINVKPKEKMKICFKYNWKERFHAGNANQKQQFGGF